MKQASRSKQQVVFPFLFAFMALAPISSTKANAQLAIDEDIPVRGIHSLVPASRWEEGLLIGNGQMGGVLYGDPGDLKVALTHSRLAIPIHQAAPLPDLTDILPDIRRHIREGDGHKASRLSWDTSKERKKIEGRLIWTDPFVNAANLRIAIDGVTKPDAYRRSLDYRTSLSRIQCVAADTLYEQRAFMSRADNLLVLELRAKGAGKLNGSVQLLRGDHKLNDKLKNSQHPSVDGAWLSARYGYALNDGGYEVLGHVKGDGRIEPGEDGLLRFKDASSITVYLRIQLLDNYAASKFDTMRKEIASSAEKSFDALVARHTAIHGGIYDRVKINLGGDPGQRAMPAEMLWQMTNGQKSTPALLERVFDAGRYQILCSSGYGPPNLQGIWAVGPAPWSGDYTHNGNVPTAISNMLNGNMPELMLSYTGYLESMMEEHKTNARQLYGARGIMLASRTHLHGHNIHYNATYPHQFWVAAAPWAASFFYDYYLHTGDEEFLRKHALPWMEQCALFFEDFLIKDAKGVYEFNPSYSPELFAGMNATMDVAAVKKLLRNLIEAYQKLGLDPQQVAKWQGMLAGMPKYRTSEGMLAEWIDPRLKEQLGHRHCSHFLPLWFGVDPEIAQDPGLLKAARNAVLLKTARRKSSGTMAFGTAMVGWAAASLGEADAVDAVLENLSTRFYYRNFASSHNSKKEGPEIFNTDICGGLPALMVEMLLQSEPGQITLLPALPARFETGEINGASCRGQVTVEKLAWSPQQVKLALRSPVNQKLTVRIKAGDQWNSRTIDLEAGKSSEFTFER